MSRRTRLLLRAARCYSEARAHTEAARCYDLLGWRWSAADAYQRAGDLEHAAHTYRLAGHPEQAARCYRLLGRADLAARCWQERGRRLEAAWELLLTGETEPARRLLAAAARDPGAGVGRGPQQLRLELARALADRLGGGAAGPLLALLPRVEHRLPVLAARSERRLLLEWAVEASDRIERFDWGARLFRAAHSGQDAAEVLPLWRAWASDRLGSTAWLPGEAGETEDTPRAAGPGRVRPAGPGSGAPASSGDTRAEGRRGAGGGPAGPGEPGGP